MGDENWGAKVIWHGHSCFSIQDSLNRTIVVDPFDETVGYGKLDLRSDALLISHEHFDHNHRTSVKTMRRQLDIMSSTGTFSVASGVWVTGMVSDHDQEGGDIHGPNRIFTFVLGGLRFVHLGDINQKKLTERQKTKIGPVDVLFVPVGGKVTWDAQKAKEMVNELKPKIVFPMHYGTIRFFSLDPVKKFTKLFPKKNVNYLKESMVRVQKDVIHGKPVVYVLNPVETNY